MFHDGLPPVIVQRIWAAHAAHFSGPYRNVRLTMLVLCGHLEKPLGHPEWENLPSSQSTVERARRKYPKLLPWPMTRYMRPPWEDQPEVLADPNVVVPRAEDRSDHPSGEVRLLATLDGDSLPVVVDVNGIVRVLKNLPSSLVAAAAMLTGIHVTDGLDGRMGDALHWCHFVAGLISNRPF
jgi:hypothetical protein